MVVLVCVCLFSGTLQPVSPWRWLFSILVPLTVTMRALKRHSLDRSGALAGEYLSSPLPTCVMSEEVVWASWLAA